MLCSLPCFPWWRILLLCYFVSALHPPRDPCEPEVCVFPLRAVFLALLMLTCLYFFFSSYPFSISIWASFVFIQSFSCGYYAVSSVSLSAATRLAYDMYLTLTYADLTFLFLSEVDYTICFSYSVCDIIFCFICFPPEVISAPELLEPAL